MLRDKLKNNKKKVFFLIKEILSSFNAKNDFLVLLLSQKTERHRETNNKRSPPPPPPSFPALFIQFDPIILVDLLHSGKQFFNQENLNIKFLSKIFKIRFVNFLSFFVKKSPKIS